MVLPLPSVAHRNFDVRSFDFQFLGGLTARVTPVPIPNTEVKPRRADDTARVTARERRSPPGIKYEKGSEQSEPFCFCVTFCIRLSCSLTVSRSGKILEQILRGTSDANISFSSMRRLLAKLGFQERVKGDHHIFARSEVEEILNLQPRGAKCKPYQVKQVRSVILRYKLAEGKDA